MTVAAIAGLGDNNQAIDIGAGWPAGFAAVVLGAWIVGLEYGQRTIRRTLSSEPRRGRVPATKFAVAILATTVVTIAVYAPAVALFPPITAALALIFVLDPAPSAIPTIGDYGIGTAATDLAEYIRDTADPHHPWRALATLVG